MNIYMLIDALLEYGKEKGLLEEIDYYYTLNALLAIFKLDEYVKPTTKANLTLDEILNSMLDYAINSNLIENSNENKDLFDTKIMGVFAKKPSVFKEKMDELINVCPSTATTYFYNYCKNINYIRASRIAKDIHFDYLSKYGTIKISINMSKPEKDPNDIKKLLTLKKSSYPKCMLCLENINYAGHVGFPARQTLMVYPLTLANEHYYMQYSPYSYFNEHTICFHEDHFNMRMTNQSFKELVSFINIFPHYFIGSNTNLPIVGGSILNHQHFQGGKAILPMENAKEVFMYETNGVNVYKLIWPMNAIRLKCKNDNKLLDVAFKILAKWLDYENKDLMIINSKEEIHNTITPITRKKNEVYEFDLVLRNNITTSDRPLGLFHPQEKYWHIKKENIGLIEVMGLAILPSRLNNEMKLVKKYLLNESLSEDELNNIENHIEWANEIKHNNNVGKENVDAIVNDAIGEVFVNVLKDCAVFKDENIDEFDKFINSIKE